MSEKTLQKQKMPASEGVMPLGKQNYILMFAGFVLIVIGFALMTGGRNIDPNEFGSEMFSFRRITLAPIVVIAGFVLEIYAIMKKRGGKKEEVRGK